MTVESRYRSISRPRILPLLVVIVVAAPIVVANLNHEPRRAWPPLNAAYGWPMIWYWCEFKPTSPARIGGGAPWEMGPVLVEWSGAGLAVNIAIWLSILFAVAVGCRWLLGRHGHRLPHRLRLLTFFVLLLVAAPIVLANLSSEDARWPGPGPTYGWPLTWRWREVQRWYGATTTLDLNYNVARLTADLAIWVVMLAVVGFICEWLLRRYQPKFRWSLRTMLATVGVTAAVCASYAAVRNRADLQDPVISRADSSPGQHFYLYLEHSGPKWLDLLGADRLRRRVVGADIRWSTDADDEILKRLAQLPDLRYVKIDVWHPTRGMPAALAELRRVRSLRIDGSIFSSDDLVSEECFAAIREAHSAQKPAPGACHRWPPSGQHQRPDEIGVAQPALRIGWRRR